MLSLPACLVAGAPGLSSGLVYLAEQIRGLISALVCLAARALGQISVLVFLAVQVLGQLYVQISLAAKVLAQISVLLVLAAMVLDLIYLELFWIVLYFLFGVDQDQTSSFLTYISYILSGLLPLHELYQKTVLF